MKKNQILTLTRGGIVAALYVALTYLSFLFGLSSGAIQLRLSEMLTVLPAFLPESIPGLYIGCLIANLLTGGSIYDILLGSLATLIGAIGARMLRKAHPLVIALPTVFANALIVPLVIILSAGGAHTFASFPYFAFTVGIGEFLSAGVLGAICYRAIEKNRILPKL
ncbi:MAG: QueT transporter family protein [Clostridia bacterium]|nr:QueT transporter family protein [Clostridia bacterium]